MTIEPTSDPLAPTPSPGSADLDGLSAAEKSLASQINPDAILAVIRRTVDKDICFAHDVQKRHAQHHSAMMEIFDLLGLFGQELRIRAEAELASSGRLVSRSAPGAVVTDEMARAAFDQWRAVAMPPVLAGTEAHLVWIKGVVAAALAASPTAPAGEPVAWAYEWDQGGGKWFGCVGTAVPVAGPHIRNVRPLYETPTAPAQDGEIVRHVKRGTEYEVIGEAEAQVSSRTGDDDRFGTWRGLYEGNSLTVYRCLKTGKLWCRFTDEFRDGRFEPASPSKTQEG